MTTYGYDRENSEKAFEYIKLKRVQYTVGNRFLLIMIGAMFGGLGLLYARPI